MATNVSTFADLQNMANNLSEDYFLTADIDATGEGLFIPVGQDGTEFTGSFNGQGFTILNLQIDVTSGRAGLFGETFGATIQNATLENPDILSTGTGFPTGGFVGGAFDSVISKCRVIGGSIECTDAGSQGIGGIAGHAQGGGSSIDNCYTVSTVIGGDRCGGIVGTLGNNGLMTKCWTLANVSGGFGLGAMVGQLFGGSSTDNSFYDSDLSTPAAGPGTGKTTTEMQDIDTFNNLATEGLDSVWDIVLYENHDGDELTAIWFIDEGNDYPRLWFEYEIDNTASYSGQTLRNVTGDISDSSQTVRNVTGVADFSGQTIRNIIEQFTNNYSTSRIITGVASFIGQTIRSVTGEASYSGATQIIITNISSYSGQTIRKIRQSASYSGATNRIVTGIASYSSQTVRSIIGAISSSFQTLRDVIEHEVVLVSFSSKRNVTGEDSQSFSTLRKIVNIASYSGATVRFVIGFISNPFQTIRNVFGVIEGIFQTLRRVIESGDGQKNTKDVTFDFQKNTSNPEFDFQKNTKNVTLDL